MRNVRRTRSLTLLVLAFVAVGLPGLGAAAELPQDGATVPDFTLPALDGESRTLSERFAEGPVVLVFFRGVW
jgi:hypothetical protein